MAKSISRPLKSALGARTKVQAALRHAGTGPRPYDPGRPAPVDAPRGHDYDLDQLVGGVGDLYIRQGLSSPSQLRAAAPHWRGLSFSEITEAIENWLDDNR